jgi:hypothetical protein
MTAGAAGVVVEAERGADVAVVLGRDEVRVPASGVDREARAAALEGADQACDATDAELVRTFDRVDVAVDHHQDLDRGVPESVKDRAESR